MKNRICLVLGILLSSAPLVAGPPKFYKEAMGAANKGDFHAVVDTVSSLLSYQGIELLTYVEASALNSALILKISKESPSSLVEIIASDKFLSHDKMKILTFRHGTPPMQGPLHLLAASGHIQELEAILAPFASYQKMQMLSLGKGEAGGTPLHQLNQAQFDVLFPSLNLADYQKQDLLKLTDNEGVSVETALKQHRRATAHAQVAVPAVSATQGGGPAAAKAQTLAGLGHKMKELDHKMVLNESASRYIDQGTSEVLRIGAWKTKHNFFATDDSKNRMADALVKGEMEIYALLSSIMEAPSKEEQARIFGEVKRKLELHERVSKRWFP